MAVLAVLILGLAGIKIAISGEKSLFFGREVEGEIKKIPINGQEVETLWINSRTTTTWGGVLLLAGENNHADWPQVISPLRTALPNHGWSTLSLALPADEKLHQATITSALELLRQGGLKVVVMVGHDRGAVAALAFLQQKPPKPPVALVLIGLNSPEFAPPLDGTIPVLDLVGSQDYQLVLTTAKQRALMTQKIAPKFYRQVIISGADHYFQGLQALLLKTIRGWLRQTVELSLEQGNP